MQPFSPQDAYYLPYGTASLGLAPVPPPPPPPAPLYAFCHVPGAPVNPQELQQLFSSKQSLWASEIIPGLLFLGSGRAAQNLGELERRKVFYIVNVADDVPNYQADPRFVYLNLHVRDFGQDQKGISTRFAAAFAFLKEREERNEPVLVHCAAGINRSATIVIAWIMKKSGCKLEEAFRLVLAKRNICPLRDNRVELLRFEQQLHGANFLTEEQLMDL